MDVLNDVSLSFARYAPSALDIRSRWLPMWYSRSFTPPDGSVYGDRRVAVQDDKRQASFMVTRNVILSKECHSERSEESGEEGQDNGPRTSQIRILLKYKLL